MQLLFQQPDSPFYVRRCEPGRISVADREYATSFVLATDRAFEWPATSVEALTRELVEPILALAPEVVLLGTGARVHFPAPAIAAEFLKRGIGLETMDNNAAARTFNVLASESRKVVAAFILPA